MGIDPIVGALISGAFQLISASNQSDAINRQADAQRESADLQKQAEQAKARSAEVESARQRVEQMRQDRIRRAMIEGTTTNQGIGKSTSGVVGSTSSSQSQASSNIGFINQQESFAQAASTAMQGAADATSRAGVAGAEAQQWQMWGGLANKAFDQFGGFTTIFGGNKIPKA